MASTPSSSAFAKAELDQDIDQDNENSASIETPASFPNRGPEAIQFAIGLQEEEVLQANLSLQAAAAIATADAGEVQVTKEGSLDAGETGIDASSSAAAIADLDQEAEQQNEDTKEVTVADEATRSGRDTRLDNQKSSPKPILACRLALPTPRPLRIK